MVVVSTDDTERCDLGRLAHAEMRHSDDLLAQRE
jgi:hypothetical protein